MQPRVRPGVPAGGQFATSERSEAGVSLGRSTTLVAVSDDDFERVVEMMANYVDEDDIRAEFGDDVFDSIDRAELDARVDEELDRRAEAAVDAQWDPSTFSAQSDIDDVRQTIDQAYASANHWIRRLGVHERSRGLMDADDLAQDGVLTLLERQANGVEIANPKAYIHTSIRGVAGNAGSRVRQEDRAALKQHVAACRDAESRLGRELTASESDAIAKHIRDNWHDQDRKPSKNFTQYAGAMEVSVDGAVAGHGESDGYGTSAEFLHQHGVFEEPDQASRNAQPGSFTDRSLDAIEGHGGTKRDARHMLWNALAENAESVPMVAAGTLSQNKVTAARALMAEYGSGPKAAERVRADGGTAKEIAAVALAAAINDALATWDRGETDEGTEALFAPWGETTPDVRDAIAAQIRRFPKHAEGMWGSALSLANNRNSNR